MQLLRNPEVKRFTLVYIILTVAACSGAIVLFSVSMALYVLGVCFISYVCYYVAIKKRYDNIANLCLEIDKMLHAKERIYRVPNQEGELAILTNQIAKMTMRLQEQAEQLQEEKGHLGTAIADISHQIRTPLTSVRMMLHRLMKDDLSENQRNDCINEINVLLSRIEWLITALLKIARLDSAVVEFNEETVDIKELVRAAIEPLEIMMELKEITIKNSIEEGASFKGDVTWSVEALENVLKNCVEHTPNGGSISIVATENSMLSKIVITDTGSGVSNDDLPHLFERFYKGSNSSASNIGIGLALARMIISKQNGTIKAQNVEPCGTEFTITLYKGTL